MKMHFDLLFTVKSGTISPRVPIHINGTMISPGASFTASDKVVIGGIRLFDCAGKFLDAEEQNGIYHIKGYHQ